MVSHTRKKRRKGHADLFTDFRKGLSPEHLTAAAADASSAWHVVTPLTLAGCSHPCLVPDSPLPAGVEPVAIGSPCHPFCPLPASRERAGQPVVAAAIIHAPTTKAHVVFGSSADRSRKGLPSASRVDHERRGTENLMTGWFTC
jgi:hypothetical protein